MDNRPEESKAERLFHDVEFISLKLWNKSGNIWPFCSSCLCYLVIESGMELVGQPSQCVMQ